ncbi:MAG: hypothetical protein O4805_02690 [Trichodesmium sp. St16_bin2-tuft]|nr:hypothetical protein [Trichodesmium sp. St16_bin2-tuft]
MGTFRKNLESSQRSLRVENFTPKYICWALLGFVSSTLPTGLILCPDN